MPFFLLRFAIGFADKLCVLVNDEGTRTFLGVEVDQGVPSIVRIIRTVDEVLERYKQPRFYEVNGGGGVTFGT